MSVRTLLLVVLAASLSACHVHDNDWGAHEPPEPEESAGVCSGFCGHLVACGDIGFKQLGACTDTCEAAVNGKNAKAAIDGCKCKMKAACSDASYCSNVPYPVAASSSTSGSGASSGGGSSSSGSGSSGADAGSSSADAGSGGTNPGDASGTASGVYSCKSSAQCAWSEDCVSGACLVRCKASCECHAQEACSEGHCSLPVAPAPKCQTDCDCPSGGKCLANTCK